VHLGTYTDCNDIVHSSYIVYMNEVEPSPVSAIPTSNIVSFPSMHPCSATQGQGIKTFTFIAE